ncbi:DUF3800 domain-containing protein [Candidatus Shapirobacteria bacterium]|nr:DUF3800 domain-containing protein [Candidatus Shapirobacteria bacterium]
MKAINLFTDESGSSNPKAQKAGCYILCGCLINDSAREELKIRSEQIKFKFWGKTDIVFHSREIWRKADDFRILQDEKIRKEFQKLLFNLLSKGGYQIFSIVVDNSQAAKLNWDNKKVYKETTNLMVKNFILTLLATKSRGRLIVESASSEKDFYFHKAASHYLAKGLPEFNVPYTDVQNALTEISFVTKKNFDIEEQIADLLAYGAKLKFLNPKGQQLSDYDRGILKIFNQKLFTIHPQTGEKKKRFYSKIEKYKVLP